MTEKTKEQLNKELDDLRRHIAGQEVKEAKNEKVKQALIDSEEKFKRLTASAFDAIVMMDDEGKVSFWNKAAEKMFGYSAEEVIGKYLHKIIVPKRYLEDFLKGSEKFKKTGQGPIIDKVLVLPGLKKDGTEFYADHSFSATKISGKWHAISIIRDCTERKLAEEEMTKYRELLEEQVNTKTADLNKKIKEQKKTEKILKTERQKLYSILDMIPGMVYLQAPDYTIPFANRRFIDQYGDPKGKLCHEVIWDREEPCGNCPTFRVFKTKKPEVWISDRRSTGFVYKVYDYPFIDTDGSLLVMEMSIDITERKRIEDALSRSEELHRLILTNMSDAVFIADYKRKFVYICPNVDTIFGRSLDDVKKMGNISRLLGGRIYDNNDLKTSGEIKNIEHTIMDNAGNEHDLLINVKQVSLLGGTVLYTCRDITERKRMEEDIIHRSEELQELTMKMTNVEERERKRFAEILHEGTSQNLVAIKMAFENLTNKLDVKDENIKESFHPIFHLLDESISTVRSMTLDIYPTVLEEKGFASAVKWYMLNVLEPKKIKVSFDVSKSVENLPEELIRTIFRTIRECFQNILKHASASKVDVVCKIENGFLKLKVSDNGVGFECIESKVASEQGIGLTLMREWVKNLKGDFNVKTQPGKGTKVVVDLPYDKRKYRVGNK